MSTLMRSMTRIGLTRNALNLDLDRSWCPIRAPNGTRL